MEGESVVHEFEPTVGSFDLELGLLLIGKSVILNS